MKPITLDAPAQMLFALLRSSLHECAPEAACFEGVTADVWQRCYRLSCAQGVMALAWDGVMRLPAQLLPPKGVKIMWATAVEAYEQRYLRYCHVADELSALYAEHGIATVQLKGVGYSAHYPVPSHREGGDIDVYTYSSDTTRMSHAEANALADQLMRDQGIEVDVANYKHSNFCYRGIPIENHKTFLDIKESPLFKHSDKVLHQYLSPSLTTLPIGQVMTPSVPFNTLFLAFHAGRHFGSGLALHHLYDWAVLISRCGLQMPTEVTDERLLRFADVLTMLCHRYLGTSLQVEADEELACDVLGEMLYPRYLKEVEGKGCVGIVVYKLRRLFYRQSLERSVLGSSLIKHLCSSIILHMRKPETIFKW